MDETEQVESEVEDKRRGVPNYHPHAFELRGTLERLLLAHCITHFRDAIHACREVLEVQALHPANEHRVGHPARHRIRDRIRMHEAVAEVS